MGAMQEAAKMDAAGGGQEAADNVEGDGTGAMGGGTPEGRARTAGRARVGTLIGMPDPSPRTGGEEMAERPTGDGLG